MWGDGRAAADGGATAAAASPQGGGGAGESTGGAGSAGGARSGGTQRSAKIVPISPSKLVLPPSASAAVQATTTFDGSYGVMEVVNEVIKRAGNMTLVERDTDAVSTFVDKLIYGVENYLASAPGGSLNILLLITAIAI